MTADPRVYQMAYYGCGPLEKGHYWWQEWRMSRAEIATLPAWVSEEADGGLQPETQSRQQEGVVRVHRADGWTALAWWDRSMDSRPNSCSVLAIKADMTFEEALGWGRQAFPWVFERMKFQLREEGDGQSEAG